MARYFMHLRDGVDELLDAEGKDFANMEELRKWVMFTVRDLLAADIRNGLIDFRYRIDAEDEAGAIVYTLAFKHALSIIPEPI
jgi:transcription initiation factor IIE alpha subunit